MIEFEMLLRRRRAVVTAERDVRGEQALGRRRRRAVAVAVKRDMISERRG